MTRRAAKQEPNGCSYFHVTSSLNRESIREFGLDWTRMKAARGIAGSHQPEQEGCFVCLDKDMANWFIRLNNTGGPVDVWEVRGVAERELRQSPENYFYVARVIAPSDLTLVRQDVPGDW